MDYKSNPTYKILSELTPGVTPLIILSFKTPLGTTIKSDYELLPDLFIFLTFYLNMICYF